MIWYRHWLESRQILPLLVISVLVLAGPRADVLSFGPENPTRFGREMLNSPLARQLERDELLAWSAFAERIFTSVFLSGLLLAGSGLRSQGISGHLGLECTLTLPIARATVIGTRLAASFIGALVVGALVLAAHAADLLLRGAEVPLAPMAQSFAFSVPMAMAWTAFMGAAVTFLRPLWAILSSLLGFSLAIPIRHVVTAFPSRGEMPWEALAAFVAFAGIAVAFTLRKGPDREF
jgi:hypothetical protein